MPSSTTAPAIAERLGARVIRNARNEGYGRANNSGARAAESDFLLIVNPDIALEPGAVAALGRRGGRYPDAGLLAPRIVEADGRFFFQPRSLLSPYLKNPGGRLALPEGDACAPYLSGACFMIRRALFLRLGGFDENIFCSTRTTTSAAGSPTPGMRSSTSTPPWRVTGAAGRARRSQGGFSRAAGIRPGRGPMWRASTDCPAPRPPISRQRARRLRTAGACLTFANHHRTLRRLGGGRWAAMTGRTALAYEGLEGEGGQS